MFRVFCKEPGRDVKIRDAVKFKKPVDGHAPGLRGNDLANYVNAGILDGSRDLLITRE
jgi:adenine deaminase